MPKIEINACVDCPHHDINNYKIEGMMELYDMFAISCQHPKQANTEYISRKIKNSHNSIYFNCPLEETGE